MRKEEYYYFRQAINNHLVYCGHIWNNNELILCRKEYFDIIDKLLKLYQKGKINSCIMIYSYNNTIFICYEDINIKVTDKFYRIDYYELMYYLYLSAYSRVLDDRASLILCFIALGGSKDELAKAFNVSLFKLDKFLNCEIELGQEISIRKLCNYLNLEYPYKTGIYLCK